MRQPHDDLQKSRRRIEWRRRQRSLRIFAEAKGFVTLMKSHENRSREPLSGFEVNAFFMKNWDEVNDQ